MAIPEVPFPGMSSSKNLSMHLEANRPNTEFLINDTVVGKGARVTFHPDRPAPFTISARFLDCYGKGGELPTSSRSHKLLTHL